MRPQNCSLPTSLFSHSETVFLKFYGAQESTKESISPAYEAWRAGTATLFLLGS
jgi:hypothetical protein